MDFFIIYKRANPMSVHITNIALYKNFGKNLKQRLLSYLINNEILSPNQFSLLEGKSTQDAALSLIDDMSNNIGKVVSTLSKFVEKYFETVNHIKALEELEITEFRGE